MRLVLGAGVGVVGDQERAGAQARGDQREDLQVERFVPIEQDEVDRLRQIARQRLQRVALADLDQLG